MTPETAVRCGVGATGVVAGLVGAYLLLTRSDADQLLSTGIWLGAGLVVHDTLVAVLALLLVGLATRLPSPSLRTPAVAAFVVLGPLTVIAVPFLGRFGAKADNPTLLDRPYWTGYLVLVGVVLLVVAVLALVRTRATSTEERRP